MSREAVAACVRQGVLERAPERRWRYVGFVDPSGGASDSFTLGISHREGVTAILDVVRETWAPFSPEATCAEYAELLRRYRISTVYGDRYAGEWPREQFRKHGVALRAIGIEQERDISGAGCWHQQPRDRPSRQSTAHCTVGFA